MYLCIYSYALCKGSKWGDSLTFTKMNEDVLWINSCRMVTKKLCTASAFVFPAWRWPGFIITCISNVPLLSSFSVSLIVPFIKPLKQKFIFPLTVFIPIRAQGTWINHFGWTFICFKDWPKNGWFALFSGYFPSLVKLNLVSKLNEQIWVDGYLMVKLQIYDG